MKYSILRKIIISSTMCLMLFACSEKTLLKKNSTLFRLENGTTSKWDIVSYEFLAKKELDKGDKIELKDNHIKIILKNPNDITRAAQKIKKKTEQVQKDFSGLTDYRLKYMKADKSIIYFTDPDFSKGKFFTVIEKGKNSWKLAAVTVSIKNRPFLTKEAEKDPNLLSTWESKFTPGLAITNELTRRIRLGENNNINKSSIELGALLALGVQDINEKTTRPMVNYSRKALTFTFGGLINFGINNFDVGFYSGLDFTTGKGSKDWIYQWQPNIGFIFGYDIVKPQK